MNVNRCCWVFVGVLAFLMVSSAPGFAQSDRIRARITGGGGEGKCTFEVVVDGSAEIEIRGDQGFVRTIAGSPAAWKRLDCNQPLPANPVGFRFQGVDGRGSQMLLREPGANRGVAVIRIDDPKSGSEGYTGDIMWSGAGAQERRPGYAPRGGEPPPRGAFPRGRISRDEAMNICRDQVLAAGNVSRPSLNMRPGTEEPDGDVTVNFSFANREGRIRNGFCRISGRGEVVRFQLEREEGGRGGGGLAQALAACQNEAARRYGVSRDSVRVQSGEQTRNGGYTVNFQAPRGRGNGRPREGFCRVSPNGQIEELQAH